MIHSKFDTKQNWLWITIIATTFWSAAHALIRLMSSPTLGRDDAIENIFSQSLQLNYSPRQPPLYDWILWAVHQFLPPTLPSYLLIKYGFLLLTAIVYYHVALRVLGRPKQAALATLSLSLLFQIGWNHHIFITHTVLLIFFIPLAILCLLRIFDKPDFWCYVAFGLVCGFGLLSKYGFALFVVITLCASLFYKFYRPRILHKYMSVAIGIIIVMNIPIVLWYLNISTTGLLEMSADNMQASSASTSTFWQMRLTGLKQLFAGYINFLLPLALVLPLVYRFRFQRPSLIAEWLLVTVLIGFIICLLAIIVLGFDNFKERYMHALLMPFPIVLFAFLADNQNIVHQHKYFITCLILFAVTGVIVRGTVLLQPSAMLCSKNCYERQPYQEVGKRLVQAGFDPQQHTLVGTTPFESGNLRMVFPTARVTDISRPYYVPPMTTDHQNICYVVWRHKNKTTQDGNISLFKNALQIVPININWENTIDSARTSHFRLAIVESCL